MEHTFCTPRSLRTACTPWVAIAGTVLPRKLSKFSCPPSRRRTIVGKAWSESITELEDFWKTRVKEDKIQHMLSATSGIYRKLEKTGRARYSPVEIAARVDRISPLMGLNPLDVAFTVERAPELIDIPPIEFVESLMIIRRALPAGVDPSRIVLLEPRLLTTEGVEYHIAGCLAELRALLPEACVCWLVQEEPKLLLGVSLMRQEQLKQTIEAYSECIEEIEATKDAVNIPKLRMWFENVFINYY
mmetsp:Transcript_32367/g.70653  ORF Transcript_32367/g.70653 Transcript_32367/m.70653 type:complete len:245 (-) Transcript_32367:349-1083(-)|eukprot:CAMPEP_0118939486 /NCGR_PEP_ID=MMETSP1169-20130426/29034_1 /TAXON_ID=36882 /ORGANISM="Pyramimonas obovata, Strain CCMP722" /LENGTH=244 /DNA_ID=CAMNT_0006883769 /DNA_START=221 /DNA_END=955 /DNA_ORIENTATION=+